MSNFFRLGGNTTPKSVDQQVVAAPVVEIPEIIPTNNNKRKLEIESIYEGAVRVYSQMAEKLAHAARRADILTERDIETLLTEYLARPKNNTINQASDFMYTLINAATRGEDNTEKRQNILNRINAHYTRAMHYAAMDMAVGGATAEVAEEPTAWKTILACGAVVISYIKPGIFTLGTFSPWHQEGVKTLLTAVWSHQKENSPKPHISGFILPYNGWEKLHHDQLSLVSRN